MDFWNTIRSVQLASPSLFLITLSSLLLVLVFVLLWGKRTRKTGIVKLADIESIKKIGAVRAKINSTIVTTCLIIVSLLASLLVGGAKSVFTTTQRYSTTDYLRIVVTVKDISGSMLADVAKFSLAEIEFLFNAEDIIAGSVFFSDYAFTYRYPTTEIEELISSLEGIEFIRSNKPGKNQIARLSNGTNIPRGLLEAEYVIDQVSKDLEEYDSVIVFFSDLVVEGSFEDTVDIVRRLSAKGIKVFFVTDASNTKIMQYQYEIGLATRNVEFFRIDSRQDINDVLNKVAELEKAPIVQERTSITEKSITKEIAIVLAIFLGLFVIFSELFFRKTRERRWRQ